MRLFRRRLVPVPTLAGWVVLFAVAAAGAFAFVHALFPLLAPNDPVGGGILVVEGWGGGAVFDDAAARFRRGGYDKIVTTGGPIEEDTPYSGDQSWAAHAAAELRRRGIDDASIVAVPAPASARERTYLSAVMVREWAAQQRDPVTRFDLVTRGPHGRRSRRLFQTAFGDGVEVGVVSVPSRDFDAARWWASSEGTRSVVTEALGMAWTLCCFDPGPRGSEQEKWDE
jgi:uncharacterized SAM-binding protein YcdF (DUF218 family)